MRRLALRQLAVVLSADLLSLQGTSIESSLLFLHDDVFTRADWLSPGMIDGELRADLAAQRTAVLNEVTAAEAEIVRLKALVEDLWRDSQAACYILTSVFMHRGDTGFGHCTFFSSARA